MLLLLLPMRRRCRKAKVKPWSPQRGQHTTAAPYTAAAWLPPDWLGSAQPSQAALRR